MEYCSGGDLAKLIRRQKRTPEATARALLRQLAAGLRELWSRNLVHVSLRHTLYFCSRQELECNSLAMCNAECDLPVPPARMHGFLIISFEPYAYTHERLLNGISQTRIWTERECNMTIFYVACPALSS